MVRTTRLTSYRPKSASALPGSYNAKTFLYYIMEEFLAHLHRGVFRLGKNPPTKNVEAFWQGGKGGATMNKRDTQTHNTTCTVGVMKSKVISRPGPKILRHKESLS
jgi:hypothetical protein